MPNPCAIVIFGASGDLAKRKLLPALYELALQKLLDEKSYIIGFSRSADDRRGVPQAEAKDAIGKYARTKPVDEGVMEGAWRSGCSTSPPTTGPTRGTRS